jgi:hypothetical protein
MKKYRRIEITAFRRRVTIVSRQTSADSTTIQDVCINGVDSPEKVEMESAEGQQILIEAVRLLKEKLLDKHNDENK